MNYTVLAIGILVVILLVVGIGYVVIQIYPNMYVQVKKIVIKPGKKYKKLDQKVVDQGDCLENIIIVE